MGGIHCKPSLIGEASGSDTQTATMDARKSNGISSGFGIESAGSSNLLEHDTYMSLPYSTYCNIYCIEFYSR